MPAPPLNEILSVDAEVCAILGKTAEELGAMKLNEFAELSYERGIVWSVGEGGRVQGLTICIKREQSSAVTL